MTLIFFAHVVYFVQGNREKIPQMVIQEEIEVKGWGPL
jgi:hypothetical protein